MAKHKIKFQNLFCKHPHSIGESYSQHFKVASYCGLRLTVAGLACLLHSLFPFLFINTASNTLEKISYEMQERKNKKNS